MSVEAPAPGLVIPEFSEDSVDTTLALLQDNPDELRISERGLMDQLNPQLRLFHDEKLDAFYGRREDVPAQRWILGYLAGYSVLRRGVAPETGLPEQARVRLHRVAMYIGSRSDEPQSTVERAYREHPAVRGFRDALSSLNQGDTNGADYLLVAYSEWANPAGPALAVPSAPVPAPRTHLQTRGRRSNSKDLGSLRGIPTRLS